jgi:Rieske Fe-S protein
MSKYEEKFADLEAGDGAVKEIDGKMVAASRDDQGELHTCSAVCPHLGCFIRWNKINRNWNCTCHGSSFDSEGKVINGPALKDLSKDI